MFGFGVATRIYLAAGSTDMRKGFEGLYGIARDRLLCDPLSGHVFLFANAQRNRLKLLFWDGSGLWVLQAPGEGTLPLAGGHGRGNESRAQPRGVGAITRGHRSGPDPAPAVVPESYRGHADIRISTL